MNQFKYHKPCAHCDGDIYFGGSESKVKTVDGEPVCDECYYTELGDIIEKYPIGVRSHKKQY